MNNNDNILHYVLTLLLIAALALACTVTPDMPPADALPSAHAIVTQDIGLVMAEDGSWVNGKFYTDIDKTLVNGN